MSERLAADTAATGSGPCILVVEDDALFVMMLEQMLEDLGYSSIKAAHIGRAMDLAATADVDGAILDLHVTGGEVYPVADELRRRGIPFVFSTGSGPGGLRSDYRTWPTLTKPFLDNDLERILAATLAPRVIAGQRRRSRSGS